MKSQNEGEMEKTMETSNDAKLDTTLSHIIKALKQVLFQGNVKQSHETVASVEESPQRTHIER